MPDELIHPNLIEVALEKADGMVFEKFAHDFFSNISGMKFIPLGGVHDGGADAFQEDSRPLTLNTNPGVFFQVSIQGDHRTKIKSTIQKLKTAKRNPTCLYYITSRRIPKIDLEEVALSTETGISIRIRDRTFIISHINESREARNSFRNHLGDYLEPLKRIGSAQLIGPSQHVKTPAIYVFLRQEVERRGGRQSLSDSIVDSLILWALEETNPDEKRFKTRAAISSEIKTTLPFSAQVVEKCLNNRLAHLSSKSNSDGREIRHYPKEDLFCLPYETRLKVQEENATDEALRIRVLEIIENRISEIPEGTLKTAEIRKAAEIALRTLQLTFENEGLEFAAFLEDRNNSDVLPSISDHVDQTILEARILPPKDEIFKETILSALRTTFYKSTPDERAFLSKLAHTYSLLFSLQAEPRIVKYFEEMASDFNLYIGSDLIVKALSERYVNPEDQRVRTLIKMLAECGAKLILTEPVLEELQNHLKSTDNEFKNYWGWRRKS